MRIEVKCSVSAILLMLMVFAVMGMNTLSEGRYGEGARSITQPQTTTYINGSWNITTDTVRSNETIILKGNLTVEYGATLTFRNVTLIMDSPAGGTEIGDFYHIEVKRGATMNILDWDDDNTTTYDASNITINNTAAYYWFWVLDGSNFTMKNSELHHCGANAIVNCSGLYIETDNATIDHNLISNNYMGVVLYGSDATISNNTITWNDDTGIYAGYWSNGTIENNWITWNDGYGIYITGGGSTGTKPSNPTVMGNVITDTGRGTDTAVGIQIINGCKPLIKNTRILRSTEDGVYSRHSTPTLINVTVDAQNKGNYGIASSSTGYLYVINSTILNNKLYDFSISDSYFVVTNTTFNESKVKIFNSGSNLTVRWYLHVYVEDNSGIPIPAADVRIKDNGNGTYDKNFTTDDNGHVKWIVLTEFWRNNDTVIYYTPYNISVNYSGLNFSNNPRNSTINESKTEIFIADGSLPEFENIIIPLIISIMVCILFINRQKTLYDKTKRRSENERK